jgi:hypothetical protein
MANRGIATIARQAAKRFKNVLILILLLIILRFQGSKEPIFYRVQNYCFSVKRAIAVLMKKHTIINPYSKEQD